MGSTRQLEQSDPVRGSIQDAIPGIDATLLASAGPARDAVIHQLRQACTETGFFCVDNFLDRSSSFPAVLRRMDHFFGLPDSDAIKQAINVVDDDNTHGWMPLFHEPAYQPGTVAHVESFDCGRPDAIADKTSARANRWPDIPGFQADVESLWRDFTALGRDVLSGIESALGIQQGFLVEHCQSQQLSTMRLLNYPDVDSGSASESDVGIAAHTDFECITFIVQTAPGLELMDIHGDWYDAPAGPDRVVVLLGDMLERWTNGTVRATGHRVRHREFQRFSTVLFFAVDETVTVSPLPSFVSGDRPARYSGITQPEHTRRELERAEKLRDEFARRSEA